jgi:hypothetical protein
VPDDPDAGRIPPRRTYETRQGSSLLIGLAEVSFGRAAQELELFEKDDDVWGYGSVFYQGPLGSSRNRLTFAADSRRRLNGTSDRDRMFELDPNDRTYPLFGDASRRQEFATSNSKVFLRAERDSSHIMYGDLVGDLPSSATDGGRWSSYQRHLTGVEVRLANARGDHVTVRGAQPDTAYARETFAGGLLGHIALANLDVLAGTETVAIEVRDRRQPERLVSREVLTRGVDYQLEPRSATIFLTRNVSTIDPRLNLVQVVVTYEYRATGVDQLVVNGRAFGTIAGLRLGATVFTEEGAQDERFTVAGIDVERALPRKGRFRLDVPYSWGTPAVTASVDARQPDANGDTGVGVQAEVEQPFPFWSGVARARFLHADEGFRNPFSATITPGAQFIGASGDLSPRSPSRLRAGGSHERHETVAVDARRTTFFGEWAETFDWLTLSAGYDDRTLDRGGSRVDSGLVTAQAIVRAGDRFEARASREENVRKDKDPTYPDQTVLGARLRVGPDAAIFYRQRISDAAIEPIGDVARTGLAALPTTGELTLGVESSLDDTTRLTSEYRLEQGVNGPDAFALVGVHTRIGLGAGLSANFGLERGQLVAGEGDDYTSGSAALAWLTNRVKATTRYEARDRTGFASLFTAGGAARLGAGVTAAARAHWTRANQPADDETLAALAAFAIRPAGHDRVGWLLSYQYADAGRTRQTVAPGRLVLGWRHLLSTDAYGQPVSWLTLHGKFAWQRSENDGVLVTDTYLAQGRLQMAISRYVDAAFEERYLHQPASRSHREGTAFEIGAWPVADFRIAVGYNFRDTRDPSGRDLQGRDRGVYLTLSTKLSRLFDLFGNRPPDPR